VKGEVSSLPTMEEREESSIILGIFSIDSRAEKLNILRY
jgi:hypothetical protein